ncbi:MAG: RluA family pseudouridine synthase [Bilifractor sp.]
MKKICLEAEAGDESTRIDVMLSNHLPELSRSYIQKIIKDGGLLVDGHPVKSNYKCAEGSQIELTIPDEVTPDIRPEAIPLDILYEDSDLLIVNKPKQMVVHPSPGHLDHTLVNALMYHCGSDLSGINGVLRPGIVHRIDQDTTGLLVVCKNDRAHRFLAAQLAEHSITRRYRAVLIGTMKEEDVTVRGNIGRSPSDRKKMAVLPEGGKPAVTHIHLLRNLSRGFAYVQCELETGRTHQIRVHASHIHHPVLGDTVYGPAKQPVKGLTGQTLHAMTLGFIHPSTGKYMEFSAPLPDYFQELLEKLN